MCSPAGYSPKTVRASSARSRDASAAAPCRRLRPQLAGASWGLALEASRRGFGDSNRRSHCRAVHESETCAGSHLNSIGGLETARQEVVDDRRSDLSDLWLPI